MSKQLAQGCYQTEYWRNPGIKMGSPSSNSECANHKAIEPDVFCTLPPLWVISLDVSATAADPRLNDRPPDVGVVDSKLNRDEGLYQLSHIYDYSPSATATFGRQSFRRKQQQCPKPQQTNK